jgi:hypothetical protein
VDLRSILEQLAQAYRSDASLKERVHGVKILHAVFSTELLSDHLVKVNAVLDITLIFEVCRQALEPCVLATRGLMLASGICCRESKKDMASWKMLRCSAEWRSACPFVSMLRVGYAAHCGGCTSSGKA